MINVVIWLGKIKYSADLAIVFARNNIRIVDENFENTDDFIDRFDSLDANVDVLVIADALLLGADRKKLFQRIRQIEPNIRIVIVFPGYRNQYIEDQISESYCRNKYRPCGSYDYRMCCRYEAFKQSAKGRPEC